MMGKGRGFRFGKPPTSKTVPEKHFPLLLPL